MATIDRKATSRDRPADVRESGPRTVTRHDRSAGGTVPAAGAHASSHLTNEDATPGAGALPSRSHASGKEVDGAAG